MKSKVVFITGIAGFAGSHLADLLVSHGLNIYGLVAPQEKIENIKHIKNSLSVERGDLLNEARLGGLINKIKPDYVFHLAAFASVGQSFTYEKDVYRVNIEGTLNLLRVVKQLKRPINRLIFISSSDVFGRFSPEGRLLKEDQILNPVSPYAISKAAGEYMIKYHYLKNGIPGVIVRAFNHTGPRQSEHFVVPAFARQIAQIEQGRIKPVIQVGNLSAKRDISDVRDIVRGYYLAAIKGKPGDVYQLCSGRAIAIQQVLDKLLKLSPCNIKVTVDNSRLRKTEIPILRGDSRKAKKQLNWQLQYTMGTTLKDTLDYWRKKETV